MTRPATEDNELPEGWVQTRVADICHLNPPKPTPDEVASKTQVTFVPMPAVDADARAITNPQVRPFAEVRKGFTSFRDNDVILAKITPCFENKKAAVCRGLSNGLGFGSTEFHVLRSNGSVLPEYVYHFTRQESFLRDGESNMTGSVGQKRVPAGWLASVAIPLPPLAEQGRIVAKVEELLGRVNAARGRLAKVPALLKRFRQSILAAACSGELTADWREERGIGEDDGTELPAVWKRVPLRDLCDGFQYGSSRKSEPNGAIPVLRMGNIQRGQIDWSDLVYTSDDEEIEKYRLTPETVLFNRTNSPELVGKSGIYLGERPAVFAGYLVRVLHGPRLNPHYLNHCLNAPEFKDYCATVKTDGVSQSNINAQKLASFEIPWCDVNEQREIVRRVDALFALADKIEARVSAATARVEKITQAILAKAFRGELVPTEAELARQEGRDYEPASVLLDRIRAERATGDSSAPKPRSPRGRKAGERAPRRGPRRP